MLDTPVLNNLYLGDLGDYWNSDAGKVDAAHNDAFAREWGQSSMASVLAQYGAGAASFGGSTVQAGANPTTVTRTDIETAVRSAIASGALKKTRQGIYTVVLPPGTILDAGGGQTSQKGLGGFHESFVGDDGQPVYYAAIVYSQTVNGQTNGIDYTSGNAQDNISILESHEWSETETDPDINSKIPGRGLAWYDDLLDGEIGDLALQHQLPLGQTWQRDANGFAQQLEWSNDDRAYEIEPTPPPQLPAGSVTVTGSAAPNLAMPDKGTVTSTIHIDRDVNLSELVANLDIAHDFRGDLTVTVTSPSGKVAVITDRQGRWRHDVHGNFDLSHAFAGESSRGDWTLTVTDNYHDFVSGTLKGWTLTAAGVPNAGQARA